LEYWYIRKKLVIPIKIWFNAGFGAKTQAGLIIEYFMCDFKLIELAVQLLFQSERQDC